MINKLLNKLGYTHKSQIDLDVFKISERLGLTIEELKVIKDCLKSNLAANEKGILFLESKKLLFTITGNTTEDLITVENTKTRLINDTNLTKSIMVKYKELFKLFENEFN